MPLTGSDAKQETEMVILEYTEIKGLNTQRFLEQTTVVRYLIDQALAGST